MALLACVEKKKWLSIFVHGKIYLSRVFIVDRIGLCKSVAALLGGGVHYTFKTQ